MNLLPYDPTGLEEKCRELDAWRTLLDYRGPLPRAWAGQLRRELEAEAVAASTRMEGVNVTLEEVRRILAGERPSEVELEDRGLVEGVYRYVDGFLLPVPRKKVRKPPSPWRLHQRYNALPGNMSLIAK